MTSFKNSQEASFRRLVRQSVRKGGFTKSERDVILSLVNHYFHHRAKGPIRPGRNKLAKSAGVSVRTVASTLASLRAAGVLVPVSNLKGGYRSATRYSLDIHALFALCGCDWVDEFYRGHGRNCTVVKPEIARLSRAKIAHRIYNVATCPSQNGEGEDV